MLNFYAFIENNRINGVGQCQVYSPSIIVYQITEDIFNKYLEDPDYYVWNGEEVVENPDYQKIKAQKREEEFNNSFFLTHLGYVKREVTMKNGAIKDFLTDLFSSIKVGLPILVYEKPDFSQEITPEILLSLQHMVQVDEQFLRDCENQFAIDFYGFNPMLVTQEDLNAH